MVLTLLASGNFVDTVSGIPRTRTLVPEQAMFFTRLSFDWPSRTILGGSATMSFGTEVLTVTWPSTAPRANAPLDSDPR